MPVRAVAFDVLGTLFSLDRLARPLERLGLRAEDVELWMARTLRDGFALAATEIFWPFAEVARATLTRLLEERRVPPNPAGEERALDGFSSLALYDDVIPALLGLRARGVLTATLTNGGRAKTLALLRHAGCAELFDAVLSVDDVGQWKPRPEPYLAAADVLGVDPSELALVAAHAWDVHGARRAGLVTGYVERKPGPRTHVFEPPHVEGRSLRIVCDTLAPPAPPVERGREASP